MKKLCKSLVVSAFLVMLFSLTAVGVNAATSSGTYPTRKGTILVTSDAYKNLIPTGHAAIVWSKSQVIESVSKGVVVGKNNWKSTKKKVYGVTVKSTTTTQDAKAAQYCKNQVGKKYNYNYLNMSTRKKFYCSQLVWAAFYDLYKINLNTSAYTYNAIHPMELVNTSKTSLIYKYSR